MKEWIKDICVALAVALIIVQFIEPSRVYGISMLPTFEEQDYLIISRQAYEKEMPKRGDVIVFQSTFVDEQGNEKKLIKRVIGLPGETVKIKDGKVSVNGNVLDDSYTNDGYTNGEVEIIVPENEVFCLGDNRLHSSDSRSPDLGPISMDDVIGKVIFRLLPIGKFGKV